MQPISVLWRVVLAVVVALAIGSCSLVGGFADEHYVSPEGSDFATGSATRPWQTIGAAASRAKPGDTIHIMPGVYYERVIMTTSGEPDAPIRFVAQDGAIMDGTNDTSEEDENYWGGLFELRSASHVEIEGLTVRNTVGSGIFARDGGSNIVFQGNTTINTAGSGIGLWECTDTAVLGNIVEQAGQVTDGAGIQLVDAVNFEVRENLVSNVGTAEFSEDGISIARESSGGVVAANTVAGCSGRGIVLEPWEAATLTDVTVTDNLVTDAGMGVAVYPGAGGACESLMITNNEVTGCGGGLTVVSSEQPGTVTGITFNANLVRECGTSMVVDPVAGSTFDAIVFANNVAHDSTTLGLLVNGDAAGTAGAPLLSGIVAMNNTFNQMNSDGGSGGAVEVGGVVDETSTVTIVNNIFAATQGSSVAVEGTIPAGVVTVDYNLFTEAVFGADGETHGTNAIETAATLFTDAVALDFSLVAGAPAIDAGTDEHAPEDDFDGVARPQGAGIDIGAFERVQ